MHSTILSVLESAQAVGKPSLGLSERSEDDTCGTFGRWLQNRMSCNE